ncbi:MAG: hypothetical protein KA717_07725 [Woronichinia naegeliana WA131]|uniref:Uncharacterized protein n=1 Tax=Woronichinia naegeliana WA131 TaxID=2824559 RepID=A0A977L240_9CYAN|nr:MAG: hypothetical protein KA717_07725 [Woronichinia naegeliana WA131]
MYYFIRDVPIEVFGYCACILLIVSGNLVFLNSLELKLLVNKERLIVNTIILDAIDMSGVEDFDLIYSYYNEKKNNGSAAIHRNYKNYFRDIKKYIVKDDFVKYVSKDSLNYTDALITDTGTDTDSERNYCLMDKGKIDKRKIDLLQRSMGKESLIFYLINRNDSACKLLDMFLNSQSEKKSLNEKSLSNILDSIKNGTIDDFLAIIKESTGTNIENLVSQDIKFNNMDSELEKRKAAEEVIESNINIVSIIRSGYYNNMTIFYLFFVPEIPSLFIFWNILLLSVTITILCFFKSTYFFDFWLSLLYTIITFICVMFIIWICSSFSLTTDLKPLTQILVFVGLPCLFIIFQSLKPNKNKIYSSFKVFNLVAAPFAIVIFICFLQMYLYAQAWLPRTDINEVDVTIYTFVNFLVYLPFLSFTKNQLLYQLSLSKE